MGFVAAKCPSCGGDLQLDDTKDKGFCMHCGNSIVVKEAVSLVRLDNSKNIENYRKIADSSFDAGNYEDAYVYYAKILEDDFENWYAVYRRGLCCVWQSSLLNLRINELISAIISSLKILVHSEALLYDISEIKTNMAKDIKDFCFAYQDMSMDHYDEYSELESSAPEYISRILGLISALDFAQALLNFDTMSLIQEAESLKLNIIQSAIRMSSCINRNFKYKAGIEYNHFWGSYDDIIETHTLSYEQTEFLLDLKIKWDDELESTPSKVAQKEEKLASQTKYWDEHPEEYQAHLEEQRKIGAEINQIRSEIELQKQIAERYKSKIFGEGAKAKKEANRQINILNEKLSKCIENLK